MRIQYKHLFHGAALSQIVEHKEFTALNKLDDKYGHYQVNEDIRLLIKYSSAESAPWHFSFTEDHLKTVWEDLESDMHFFLCLVCGLESVCVLDEDEITGVINPKRFVDQWVEVSTSRGRSMRVRGTMGDLEKVVAHNRYPNVLFQ